MSLKRKFNRNKNYDEQILNLLKEFNIPLPLNFISYITGIPKHRACKVCKRLIKWGYIKQTTVSSASFYEIKKK
ncbi:MAG: hypothetical protein ACTSP3_12565, partial [Candidatus Heimdallarchaeaceae archaeon]